MAQDIVDSVDVPAGAKRPVEEGTLPQTIYQRLKAFGPYDRRVHAEPAHPTGTVLSIRETSKVGHLGTTKPCVRSAHLWGQFGASSGLGAGKCEQLAKTLCGIWIRGARASEEAETSAVSWGGCQPWRHLLPHFGGCSEFAASHFHSLLSIMSCD